MNKERTEKEGTQRKNTRFKSGDSNIISRHLTEISLESKLCGYMINLSQIHMVSPYATCVNNKDLSSSISHE
jgi:hypothetical protein